MTKRTFDIVVSSILLMVVSLPCIFISVVVKLSSSGPIFYWSDRIGANNKIFSMPKFRSMVIGTPEVASEKLTNQEKYITVVGRLLRMSSLDEVPQLYSVLIGDMSLVGPRPALHTQKFLIKRRAEVGVSRIRPGITGLAQVEARHNTSEKEKVEFDLEYLSKMNLIYDIKILFLTVGVIFKSTNI
jgi:O-antigen biosynthesis protein WbqP